MPALAYAALPLLAYVAGKLCSDSCGTSKNGVCEDTGQCAFGTDCGDCGQREYCCSPSVTVCDEHADHRIQREVNHRRVLSWSYRSRVSLTLCGV